jgi:hypothetical protein
MKKPKKITIKHYLHQRNKPVIEETKKYWSVYISVTVNRFTTKFKSSINEKFEDIETMQKKASKEIQIETQELEQKIRLKLSFDKDYIFQQPARQLIINNSKTVIQLENEVLRLKRLCKKQAVKISQLQQTNLF